MLAEWQPCYFYAPYTRFGVGRSSRFSFRAQTHTHADPHTDAQSQIPLITLSTHWLPLAWVNMWNFVAGSWRHFNTLQADVKPMLLNDVTMQDHEQLQSRYQLLQTHCEDMEKTCAELGSQLSQYVNIIALCDVSWLGLTYLTAAAPPPPVLQETSPELRCLMEVRVKTVRPALCRVVYNSYS